MKNRGRMPLWEDVSMELDLNILKPQERVSLQLRLENVQIQFHGIQLLFGAMARFIGCYFTLFC